MKVVIIGGGIAGLTLGIFLHQKDVDVVVCERNIGIPSKGLAFLIHRDGLATLNELKKDSKISVNKKRVGEYVLSTPEMQELMHVQLESWYCVSRTNMIKFLYSLLPNDRIKEGKLFSHFIYENRKAIAAVFLDGSIEYGDIFVGADGGRSVVRDVIFGKVDFTPIEVKEIVGMCKWPEAASNPNATFNKYQRSDIGLAFGLIPASDTHYVWFLQFDPSISDIESTTPQEIKAFCQSVLHNFPPKVKQILKRTNFSASYVWITKDFDLLPSFHKENVVLIGDAAHLTLPFTSAGTTNAILDAKTVANCLSSEISYDKSFSWYYECRAADIQNQIELGRDLKRAFLNPNFTHNTNIPVPLFSTDHIDKQSQREKPIRAIYFTDPICSTCWLFQPILRKVQLVYGEYISFEYRMGGLLPSWDQYKSPKIRNPKDAALHWEEVCAIHDMPIDGDIWIEDPLQSSYPPSIAFKAAQMQDPEKALLFLRRMKEMVFLEKKNITKWNYLEQAALSVGLDSARLFNDYNGRAQELFKEDLHLAREMGVTGFPTFFFGEGTDKVDVIKGLQSYDEFEKIILALVPSAKKATGIFSPEYLFSKFPTMTVKEFAFLNDISKEKSIDILTSLFERGAIDKYDSKNGVIWRKKVTYDVV